MHDNAATGIDISMLICSNRAPDVTDELLDTIAGQQEIERCELIFVDNGLSAHRADQLRRRLASFPCPARFVVEPVAGIWHARRSAIKEAVGGWLFTLDDDNILEEGAVASLLAFVEVHPEVGGLCPRITPRWESQPPSWLRTFGLCCLSYTDTDDRDANEREVVTPSGSPPYRWAPGGGMIVRREVGEEFVKLFPSVPQALTHRRYTAEDQMIFSLVGNCGYTYAYVPAIRLLHDLPAERLGLGELTKLNIRMLESYGHYERYRQQVTKRLQASRIALAVMRGQSGLISCFPATWWLVVARIHGFLKTFFPRYGALFLRRD